MALLTRCEYFALFEARRTSFQRPLCAHICTSNRYKHRVEVLGKSFGLLERIPNRIILADPNFLLLLRHLVLHPRLPRVLLDEFPDEAWVPELAGHAEVFAAAHQRVGFAALGGGGDAFGGEVVLFAAGDGDESDGEGRSDGGDLIRVDVKG